MSGNDLGVTLLWLSWLNWAKLACAVLIAIGVAGAFISDWAARPLLRTVEKARALQAEQREQVIVQANQQAEAERLARAQIEARLAEMHGEIAAANQHAAEAKLAAEQASLERAKIEEKLQPRTLEAAKQVAMRDQLKPLAPQSVDIFMYGDGFDVVSITDAITGELREAGWHATAWRALGAGGATGILVQTHLGSPPAVDTAADALVKALNGAGLQATRWASFTYAEPHPQLIGAPWSTRKASAIRVIVGGKP